MSSDNNNMEVTREWNLAQSSTDHYFTTYRDKYRLKPYLEHCIRKNLCIEILKYLEGQIIRAGTITERSMFILYIQE